MSEAQKVLLRVQSTFRGSRGQGLPARLLATCMRLPKAGDGVPTTLVITLEAGKERWDRRFGNRRVETVCQRLGNGRWLERFGWIEFEFVTRREGNRIHHDQLACRVKIWGISIPLPRGLSPSVLGVEEVFGDGTKSVHVVVSAPWVGQLVEYCGVIPWNGEG